MTRSNRGRRVGVIVAVASAFLVYRWHGSGGRREIATLLAEDLGVRATNGEPELHWYPHDSSVPVLARDLRYCGVGTMRTGSRGMGEALDCAQTWSACLGDVVGSVTSCRRVEVAIVRDAAVVAGTSKEPRCTGGFFTSRVCVVRQEVEKASVVFSVTVH